MLLWPAFAALRFARQARIHTDAEGRFSSAKAFFGFWQRAAKVAEARPLAIFILRLLDWLDWSGVGASQFKNIGEKPNNSCGAASEDSPRCEPWGTCGKFQKPRKGERKGWVA